MAKRVVMSYGHGKNTYSKTGSKGVTKNGKQYPEHEHNYKVGVQVTKILKDHGVTVKEVQAPNGATDVALSTRTSQANAWGADLYYSIHSNAGAASARGYAAFYWSTSKEGKKVAELYKKHLKEAGFPLYSGGTYASVKGTWNDFAELRNTAMTAVLTENGFMTNKDDFELIYGAAGQKKEAIAHAKTILEYLGIKYKGETPAKVTEPKKETPKVETPKKAPVSDGGVYRVIVDGKQVGAFGTLANITEASEKAVKDGAKDVKIERV